MTNNTHGSGLPLTGGQQRLIDTLSAKALQNDDDYYAYNDRLIERFGEPPTVEGGKAWPAACLSNDGERISRSTASVCIEILKAMASEPRCPGYCGQRGVKHSTVRYYDDHPHESGYAGPDGLGYKEIHDGALRKRSDGR